MIGSDVKLIEYTYKVDFGNCITHAIGAGAGAAGLCMMLAKAQGIREIISAVIYGLAIIAVYTVSAVYHGLPIGEAKRKARLIDHSTVPVLIAGTATPCAMITLWNISAQHCLFVMALGWGCTIFGIISKLFFFEKLKAVTMVVYIVSGFLMLASVVPLLGEINASAFGGLIVGNVFYLIGGVFCAIGKRKPAMHIVFHILTVIGSAIHFYVIYSFII